MKLKTLKDIDTLGAFKCHKCGTMHEFIFIEKALKLFSYQRTLVSRHIYPYQITKLPIFSLHIVLKYAKL